MVPPEAALKKSLVLDVNDIDAPQVREIAEEGPIASANSPDSSSTRRSEYVEDPRQHDRCARASQRMRDDEHLGTSSGGSSRNSSALRHSHEQTVAEANPRPRLPPMLIRRPRARRTS